MGNRFTLTVSTWRAHDPDATHFYGRVKSEAYALDLEKRYATCTTLKFNTEAEVVEAAKAWFQVHGRSGDVLVFGGEVIMRARGRRVKPRKKSLFRGARKPKLLGAKRTRVKKMREFDPDNF